MDKCVAWVATIAWQHNKDKRLSIYEDCELIKGIYTIIFGQIVKLTFGRRFNYSICSRVQPF